METSTHKYRKRLATLWFTGAGILFVILILQTIFGHYGEQTHEAWGWFLPIVMPTLSLIIGVLVIHALGKGVDTKIADIFLFRLSYVMSTGYLLIVALVIFSEPVTSFSPLELMKESSIFLGPLQGLVSASLGAFFVKREGS